MSESASAPQMDPATLVAYWNLLQASIFQVQVYYAALCSIVFYEWFVNLKREYRLIWKAEWTLIKYIYLLIRYTGIFHSIIDLYAYYGNWKPTTCQQFIAFIPAFPVFGVVLSHIIMLVQCHAVWNKAPFVLFLLIPLMVAEAIVMSYSSFMKIDALPLMSETGPCLPMAVSTFVTFYFAVPMIFDLTVTVLTAIKTLPLRHDDNGIGVGSTLVNTIIQQSFQYFIFITAANLTNIIYYAIDVHSPTSSLNGPLAIIATELFACRLTLSLREVKDNGLINGRLVTRTEKGTRSHFVKIVIFGDGGNDQNELQTLQVARPASAHTSPVAAEAPFGLAV